jgi:hypothetical protein
MGENKYIRHFLDIAPKLNKEDFFGLEKAEKMLMNVQQGETKSVLFSRGNRKDYFFTEDSKLYFSPKETECLKKGIKLNRKEGMMDSVSNRIVQNYLSYRPKRKDKMYKFLLNRYSLVREEFSAGYDNFSLRLYPSKVLNASIIGAILLGMISMTFIYRYLGQGASAESIQNITTPTEEISLAKNGAVSQIQNTDEKISGKTELSQDEVEYIGQILNDFESKKNDDFEKKVRKMVKGYPIENMVPYILEKDKTVAAFIIGIARKESGWGEHVPVLNGQDCYNYWGYRGIRDRMGTGGHTCFDSPKDAVDTVAKRIGFLVSEKNLNTPAKMSIWKCGSACAKDGGVKKWISDVDLYFKKLND